MDQANAVIKLLAKPDLHDLSGEKVMVDLEHGQYLMLAGSGSAIWELLEDGLTVEALIAKLLELYEVDEAACRADTWAFLHKLETLGLIALS